MQRFTHLDDLPGTAVSAVCFVMDYVEIHFHGPVLRCLAHPLLEQDGRQVRFPLPGSRDTLCSLIGTEVRAVRIQDDLSIEIDFVPDRRLIVPLTPAHRHAGEAAHFVPDADQPIQVW